MIACNKVKDAAAHLANDGVALLICEYKLDQQNGVEFLRETREQFATLPTILLLNPLEEMSVDRGSCCADVVVAKQANEVQELVRSVERLLARKAPRKKPAAIRKNATTVARTRKKA
ncbi:MAG: hypothetical protein U5J83_02665 [Bryobacterales bacterium]|nr:hypothetical protein [Bryobacterales bacterium]